MKRISRGSSRERIVRQRSRSDTPRKRSKLSFVPRSSSSDTSVEMGDEKEITITTRSTSETPQTTSLEQIMQAITQQFADFKTQNAQQMNQQFADFKAQNAQQLKDINQKLDQNNINIAAINRKMDNWLTDTEQLKKTVNPDSYCNLNNLVYSNDLKWQQNLDNLRKIVNNNDYNDNQKKNLNQNFNRQEKLDNHPYVSVRKEIEYKCNCKYVLDINNYYNKNSINYQEFIKELNIEMSEFFMFMEIDHEQIYNTNCNNYMHSSDMKLKPNSIINRYMKTSEAVNLFTKKYLKLNRQMLNKAIKIKLYNFLKFIYTKSIKNGKYMISYYHKSFNNLFVEPNYNLASLVAVLHKHTRWKLRISIRKDVTIPSSSCLGTEV